ncbi:MAG: putative DNA binding domain-containing protein [bacterium]|nr:putative DNA binding domain-containing protein [bacterium]
MKKTESTIVKYLKQRGWDKTVIADLLSMIKADKASGHPQITRIKPNPIIIVKNFLILQAAAIVAYFVAGSITHYAQIYRSLGFSQAISYQIAQALFLLGVEVILVFYIFFRWHREYYEIKADQIVHAWGILYRRREIVPLSQVASVAYHQGPLGKLVRYGTLELKDNQGHKIISFPHIPDPQHHVELIVSVKQKGEPLLPPVEFTNYQPDLHALLEVGEGETLEFKSSFRWDLRGKKVNRQLEKSVMKTVAAFLNSRGGHLVLGVDDNKSVIGLGEDFSTLGKENSDGFENHFSHVFRKMIGAEFRQFVRVHWGKINDKECCILNVAPSPKPAYLRTDDNEEFYIRTGNGTTSLKFSEATAYIDSRFKTKLI